MLLKLTKENSKNSPTKNCNGMGTLQVGSKGWYGGCGDKDDVEGMECQDFEADKLSEWDREASYDIQEEKEGGDNTDTLDRMVYLLNASSSSSRDMTCFSGGGRGGGHPGKCLEVDCIQSEEDNNNCNNFNMDTFESSYRNNHNSNNYAHQTNKADKCSSRRGRVPKSWSSCCWSSGNASNNVIFRTYLILFLILIHQKGTVKKLF